MGELDVISYEDAKAAINMADTSFDHDGELSRHISAVSALLDDAVGPIVQRPVVGETHDGGRDLILLARRPVASITLVRYQPGSAVEVLPESTFDAPTADGWYAPKWDRDPTLYSGLLYRGRDRRRWGHGQVEVTYTAGRFASTAEVASRYADTAAAILRRLWKREAGTWAQSATYFENLDVQSSAQFGFFRVAMPIIEEMLGAELIGPEPRIG